jgi:hypothetical protein
MSVQSTALSKHEKRKRVRASASPDIPSEPVIAVIGKIYSRKVASELFLGGISVASMKRMEAEGILKPVRLNKRSATSQVFYTHDNLMKVITRAEGEDV